MKSFLNTKTGLQTLAGIIILLSFPFLYFGQENKNNNLMVIGMGFIISSMLLSPVMKLLKLD